MSEALDSKVFLFLEPNVSCKLNKRIEVKSNLVILLVLRNKLIKIVKEGLK